MNVGKGTVLQYRHSATPVRFWQTQTRAEYGALLPQLRQPLLLQALAQPGKLLVLLARYPRFVRLCFGCDELA